MSGAGAGAQNVMGVGVFFGMLVATALGVFIIPGNFTFIEGLGRKRKREAVPPPVPATVTLTDALVPPETMCTAPVVLQA